MSLDRSPPPPLPFPMPPEDIGKKLLLLALAAAAFPTGLLSLLGVFALIGTLMTEGPRGLTSVFGFVPLWTITGAVFWGLLRVRRDVQQAREARELQAKRTEARMRASGSLGAHARAVAGVAPRAPVQDAAASEAPLDGTAPASLSPSRPAPPVVNGSSARFASAPEQVERARCRWCGTWVSVALADASTGMARCPTCAMTFSMRDEVHTKMGMRPRPADLDVVSDGDLLVITHRAHPPASLGWLFLLCLTPLLAMPHAVKGTIEGIAALVLVVAFVAAVLVTAWMRSTQRTVYAIEPRSLRVELKGVGGREIGTWTPSQVDQVFVRERTRSEWRSTGTGSSRRKKRVTLRSYDIALVDVNDRETRLASELPRAEHALYIEQEIENRFGIVDRAMGKGPQR